MKNRLITSLKYLFFWYVFFQSQRILFLVFNYHQLSEISYSAIFKCFYKSISIDISAISYIFIIPFFLIFISFFLKKNNAVNKILLGYSLILILINCLIYATDIGLYNAWSSKINSKFISYLMFPAQAIKTIEGWFFIVLIFILIFESFIFVVLFAKLFKGAINVNAKKIYFCLIYFCFFGFAIFVGIRGGLQDFPINRSWVYYSKHHVLNNASVNSFWNVLDVLFNREIKQNPYNYFKNDTRQKNIENLFSYHEADTSRVLMVDKPNVVIILLESWSAAAIESLGGTKGITPGFDALCSDGILFTNFYSSGFRTEQGLIAIISGFPAQPKTTIMRKFGKFEFLPNLNKILARNGYHTSYYYTGDIEFANTEPFLNVSGFDVYYSEKTFQAKRKTRWGAYDEELFNFHLKDIKKNKQAFFSIIMTSTSHELFTADVAKKINKDDEPSRYLNTIAYTDSCLYDYINKAKKEPWYANTLFIITADHGHYNPNNCGYNTPARHHIPMLWLGGALNPSLKNSKNIKTSYHVDISKSLLDQLRIKDSSFIWSKNFFTNDSSLFAFYTFDNGFGMIRDKSFVVYDHNLNQIIISNGTDEEIKKLSIQGKSFLQTVFQKYLDFNN